MEKEEDILRLVQEIRDTQQERYEEWKKARDDALHVQKQALKKSKVNIFVYLLILVGLVILFNIPFANYFSYLRTPRTSFLDKSEHYEARGWISTNNNVSPLASNRFGAKENALSFVEQLYKAGAEIVYVTSIMQDAKRIKEEGGPYANSIVVVLPRDKDKRKKLVEINNIESRKEGFNGVGDIGQKELFFWWD
jgi:hypothetical protein